jgi:hypothetical protein
MEGQLFQEADGEIIEGIILKDPKGINSNLY